VGAFIDLTGKEFDRLTVIERAETINKRTRWLCKCKCSKLVTVGSYDLLKGRTKSCGCLRKEKLSNEKTFDLTGQRFCSLTVLHQAESRKYNGLSNGTRWVCLCDCGRTVTVLSQHLRNGIAKTCGHKEHRVKDITGQRFGYLTVVQLDHVDRHAYWLCRCDCGNFTVVEAGCLTSGNTSSCGCIHSINESIIQKELTLNHIPFVHEKAFASLQSKKEWPLRFDFAIYNNSGKIVFLLEYQGAQHYGSAPFGEYQRSETDQMKKEWCLKNGIPLEEIRYDESTIPRLYEILEKYKLIPCRASDKDEGVTTIPDGSTRVVELHRGSATPLLGNAG